MGMTALRGQSDASARLLTTGLFHQLADHPDMPPRRGVAAIDAYGHERRGQWLRSPGLLGSVQSRRRWGGSITEKLINGRKYRWLTQQRIRCYHKTMIQRLARACDVLSTRQRVANQSRRLVLKGWVAGASIFLPSRFAWV